MKKGDIIEIEMENMSFPNKAYGIYEEKKVFSKTNSIIGQKLRGKITKMRKDRAELGYIEILEKAPYEIDAECKHFEFCGGCTWQNIPYEKQLELKSKLVNRLLQDRVGRKEGFFGIVGSPVTFEYRNKMELTFGNSEINGPLTLGLHKRGSFYDIITVFDCKLMDGNFRKIIKATLELFAKDSLTFYHKKTHIGFLRNLIIRKGEFTGELLINLVTSSQSDYDMEKWSEMIMNLELDSKITGIIHTINDNISDTVNSEEERILYGERDFNEKILGLNFKISPYSFFQTNSLGAELLYSKVREFISDTKGKVIFDLFSGTGTIGQIVSKDAAYVYGIELIEEAVVKANENTRLNNIKNCEFIAGDVFEKLKDLSQREIVPDIIILDPPRPGVGNKALEKILEYETDKIIYVSCNPKTLATDLDVFIEHGYEVINGVCIDMFPHTPHVETVVELSKLKGMPV